MPKRIGYLYSKIYVWDNLLISFYQARRSKRSKNEVAELEFDLENNLNITLPSWGLVMRYDR